MTVNVPDSVQIRRGGAIVKLSDLRVGDRVHVRGTKNGTSVMATEVELQSTNQGPSPIDDDPKDTEVELKGSIQGLRGGCPAIQFTIGSAAVVTSASTRFDDASCGQVANGMTAEVKGSKQPNGTVNATRVKVEKAEDETKEVELTGTVWPVWAVRAPQFSSP